MWHCLSSFVFRENMFHIVCLIGKLIPHFAHWCALNQYIAGGFTSLEIPLRYLLLLVLATIFSSSSSLLADEPFSNLCSCLVCRCALSFVGWICWKKPPEARPSFGSLFVPSRLTEGIFSSQELLPFCGSSRRYVLGRLCKPVWHTNCCSVLLCVSLPFLGTSRTG